MLDRATNLGSDAATIAQLADEAAIRMLGYRYADAVDRNDGEALAALFTQDGVIDSPNGRIAGFDALRALPDAMRGRYLKTFHAVLNQLVVLDDDRATGTTYCIARHLVAAPAGNQLCYEITLRYADELVRSDGRWLFAHRLLHVDWTHVYQVSQAPDSVTPLLPLE